MVRSDGGNLTNALIERTVAEVPDEELINLLLPIEPHCRRRLLNTRSDAALGRNRQSLCAQHEPSRRAGSSPLQSDGSADVPRGGEESMDALTWFNSVFQREAETPTPLRADAGAEPRADVPLHLV